MVVNVKYGIVKNISGKDLDLGSKLGILPKKTAWKVPAGLLQKDKRLYALRRAKKITFESVAKYKGAVKLYTHKDLPVKPEVKEETQVVEEPKVEETPVVEEPKVEETPVVEEPKVEETPVVEEPKVEETPVVEEPKVEETPVVEEPKVEEAAKKPEKKKPLSKKVKSKSIKKTIKKD